MKKIVVQTTPEQLARAKAKAKALGQLRQSIREGRGNLVGYIGQITVADYYDWAEPDTYDFDVIASDGSRLDVKSKKRSVPCQPHYEFSVAAYNTGQECRGYVPVSIFQEKGVFFVEIMGWIPKDQFEYMATFMKAGTEQPNMKQKVIRADCYNMAYAKLIPIDPPLISWQR